MKLRNYEVEPLGKLLYSLSLKGGKSRLRTRFVKLLDSHLKEVIGEERQILIEQYAERDVNGELIQDDENGNIKLLEDTAQEFFLELNVLMNEDFHIEETEANKMMILSVSEIILEGDFEVSGEVATMYDKWCEQFEEIIVRYNNEENKE